MDGGSGPSVYLRRARPQLTKVQDSSSPQETGSSASPSPSLEPGTYWLTRVLLLRYVAFIYGVAFLVALQQNKALLGQTGLLPVHQYLDRVAAATPENSTYRRLVAAPTTFWFFDYARHGDLLLDGAAYIGLALSAFVAARGGANVFIMASLWVVYHSIANVGQRWYSFGWESQMLESGFIAILLCPVTSTRALPQSTGSPTPWIALWAYRWLIFRIMIGAGLIKIRGDKCWRDLTCMNYHYETQPVPNPLSYYLHQTPEVVHMVETFGNHIVELAAPWLLLLTRKPRIIGALIQMAFQVVLILSGNLSFLNWLTILPCLACFDDASLVHLFSASAGREVAILQQRQHLQQRQQQSFTARPMREYVRPAVNIALAVLLACLSVPVVQNLLSPRQSMNTSFDPLRLVNTYGAFGSVTKERTEVILQGTHDDVRLVGDAADWQEYEFKCKPGRVDRRPCIVSPYHYRLDWLMWFAAFQNYQHNPWLLHLVAKLLVNDADAAALLAVNPFDGKPPPRFVRAEHYRYKYAKLGGDAAARGQWWTRKKVGGYLPPVDLGALKDALEQMGWTVPRARAPAAASAVAG